VRACVGVFGIDSTKVVVPPIADSITEGTIEKIHKRMTRQRQKIETHYDDDSARSAKSSTCKCSVMIIVVDIERLQLLERQLSKTSWWW
jgi:hypothetical protein